MTRVKFVPITEEHILDLAENICEADRIEILGVGSDVLWGIQTSVETSDESCAAISEDGRVICLFGISSGMQLIGEGTPWFLSTEMVHKYRREVAVFSGRVLDKWLTEYPILTNYVDSRHTRAISWLRHMGATFTEVPGFGIYRRLYYKFILER